MRRFLFSFLLLAVSLTMAAQAISVEQREARQAEALIDSSRKVMADSINRAALAEDFIKVSLIYAYPSDVLYSLAGHALLRLQSPSNNLDIIYTFETEETPSNIFRFFRGNAQAGFVYAPTKVVLDDYRSQGRRVDEIQLGLSPKQEQRLWQYLDEQLSRHVMYRYDYLTTNCTTMLIGAIEYAISPSTIRYKQLPEALQGSFGAYRAGLEDVFAKIGPWQRLFWNVTLGRYADRQSPLDQLLIPYYIWNLWPEAVIMDPDGTPHMMTLGKPDTLVPATKRFDESSSITPDMIAIVLLLCALVVTFYKKTPRKACLFVDGILMAIETFLGIWLFYLCPIVGAISTDWNYLLGLFNPLPILLWLILRKKAAMRYVYIIETVIALLYLVGTPFIPQMHVQFCLPMLAACFAIRTAKLGSLLPGAAVTRSEKR